MIYTLLANCAVQDIDPERYLAEGACVFDALLTDSKHSYRVNVPYEGARYSSTPFRLDAAKGQRVRVVRLPTTTEDRRIFQVLGRTMIEFRDDRAHISQEARLANLGESTYVFPNGGMSIRLPDGFKAFESMAVMTVCLQNQLDMICMRIVGGGND